jgi:hypothetical protein
MGPRTDQVMVDPNLYRYLCFWSWRVRLPPATRRICWGRKLTKRPPPKAGVRHTGNVVLLVPAETQTE